MQSTFSIWLINDLDFDSFISSNLVAKSFFMFWPDCFRLSPFSLNQSLTFLILTFSAKLPIAFPALPNPDSTFPSKDLLAFFLTYFNALLNVSEYSLSN